MRAGEKEARSFLNRLFRLSPELVLLTGSIWIAWLLYNAPAYRIGYQKAILHSIGIALIAGAIFYLLRKMVVTKTGEKSGRQEHDESVDYSAAEAQESIPDSYHQETQEESLRSTEEGHNADLTETVSHWPLSLFFALLAGSLGKTIIRNLSFPSPLAAGVSSGIVMGLFIVAGLFVGRQVIHKINAANFPRGRKLAFSWLAAGIGLVVSLAAMYPFYLGPQKGPEIATNHPPKGSAAALHVANYVPPFQFTDFRTGKKLSSADFKDKVLLVHFWASWCIPCMEETPTVDALYRQMAPNKDFVMITVLYKDSPVNAVAYMKSKGYDFPVYVDPGGASARIFGVTGVPETYVIDKKSILKKKTIGPDNWVSPENKDFILSLLR